METGRNIHHSAIQRAQERARAEDCWKVPVRRKAAAPKAMGPLNSARFCFMKTPLLWTLTRPFGA